MVLPLRFFDGGLTSRACLGPQHIPEQAFRPASTGLTRGEMSRLVPMMFSYATLTR